MTTTFPAAPHDGGAPSPDMLRTLLDAELSMPSRLGHVVLLLAALLMTTTVVALWVTEPALPTRTQVGFAGMTCIGASWVAYASWVLSRRRPLYGRQRVIAGRMAVACTSMFVIGALALGQVTGGRAAYTAGAAGLTMAAAAVVILVRARRAVSDLTARRDALERLLQGDAATDGAPRPGGGYSPYSTR